MKTLTLSPAPSGRRLPPRPGPAASLPPAAKAPWLGLALVLLAGCGGIAGGGSPAGAGGAENALGKLDFREVINNAKDKVFPAVVYIKVLQEDFEQGKKVSQEISGSGVLISPDGEILTNWHVVDKAVEIRCLLSDGRHFDGKTVGSDKDTDLALVKLELPPQTAALPHAVIGNSTKLREGDFVMAMGAPWGLSRSVTIGIISCTRRFLPENSEYSLWLQTDAPISPGNSGGPLVNTAGEVIGINTRGVLFGGDMGFSVPSETIKVIVAQFREHKRVDWSWTGLQLQPLKDFDKNIYFDASEGVIVSETDPLSPASKSGIQARDRILEINGRRLDAITAEDLPDVRRQIALLAKEQPAAVNVVRGKETLTIQLTPTAKGKVQGDELDCPRFDFTVKTINQFENPDLHFHRKEGVFVLALKSPGNAGSSGLQEKDILISIDGKEVKTLDEVKAVHKALIEKVNERHKVKLSVIRNGLTRQVVLDFLRDHERE